MSMVSFICFASCAVLLGTALRKKADRVSPARTFLVVWLVSIGLADLKLSGFQSEWSMYAWIVLVVGLTSMLAGLLANTVLSMGKPQIPVPEIRRYFSSASIESTRFLRIIAVLSAAYFFSYAAEVLIEGQIPFLADRPDRARIEFGVFGLHLIVTTVPVTLFLIAEYFALTTKGASGRSLLGFLAFLLVVSFFMLLQRFPLVIALFMVIPLLYYSGRSLRLKNILLVGGASLVVFFYIQSFRFAQYVQDYLYVVSKMRFPIAYAFLTEPYMYVVMNLENFARAVDRLDVLTAGYFTADPLLALTGLKHWLKEYFSLVERPFLISGYNTFPFLWPYFYDFGIIGVAVIPFLLGLVVGRVYTTFRSRPSLLGLVAYCIAFFGIAISFFTNPLTMLTTVFNFTLMIVLHVYMVRTGIVRLPSWDA